jgi:FixJ family two-component response regulator
MGQISPTTSPAAAADESIVYVIDDDRLMLGALSTLFRSIELGVRTFSTATEFLQHALPALPSCLVLDIRMPRMSGLDLQAELGRLGINMPIIFITGHGDISMSVSAMKAGAVDFLTKPFRDQEMVDAVTAALQRDLRRRSEEKSHSEIQARFASLTRRERQIMGFVTGGLMNKQVAARIGISEPTVKIHRGNLVRKMHARSLAELVLIAERLGVRDTTGSSHD